MNFSEAVRRARPSDIIVGEMDRIFKVDGYTLKVADADDFKKDGTIPSNFVYGTPNFPELVDLSWVIINQENLDKNLIIKFKGGN